MAQIQFARGLVEDAIPTIRLTRSRTGDSGTATFYFESPNIFADEQTQEVTGMYLIDSEGEIVSREVKGKFINGKPHAIEAILIMNSPDEWERFMRFMERYAQEHGLEFTKA
ncbi:photosystem II reaction center protein Psb28 [Gloeothece citriformis PCC 7424]|uniref:Photosystem II reaction center Psb28 protein n=1 Tax=Gloeothece citriformis (strain PCC 7424) TaxID=65393 RepID=PSB28_GLOC7|nr:photosystem II reaction center protein Psb28 [Gloeothece citriformis]B7K9Y7.1 RecName: Full=Photosystem II reaction center Psb28 protein; AltName: Full=Photosystem II 13 kDa protein; AltName: Full=Photosystem II reaction center W protein [Gloeothece citriformis PCC 7424]ACK71343.1 photosystem II reaction center protein Psb28 [Gloeothece citriformis PCC 7424]